MTDRRPVPRGVLPRGVQTWLMAALAVGMLLIIFLTGQPEAPAGTRTASGRPAGRRTPTACASIRSGCACSTRRPSQDARDAASPETPLPPSLDNDMPDRRRRWIRSPRSDSAGSTRACSPATWCSAAGRTTERPDAGTSTARRTGPAAPQGAGNRRSTRSRTRSCAPPPANEAECRPGRGVLSRPPPSARSDRVIRRPNRPATYRTPSAPLGPLHRVLEGTLIDAVLTNRLDGSAAAPVSCLVTNPVYSHSGQHVLIPAGARVLGETRPVQTLGETRLAVAFHRLLMPDGSTVALDQFLGLNQIGDAGLRDRVNHHYWSTFGAAAAVGLVSGLAQLLGTAGLGQGDGDRTVVIAGGAADATAQASVQVMNRFLNRLPTITIREGHRVKVYVTSDLELPAWAPPRADGGSQRR